MFSASGDGRSVQYTLLGTPCGPSFAFVIPMLPAGFIEPCKSDSSPASGFRPWQKGTHQLVKRSDRS